MKEYILFAGDYMPPQQKVKFDSEISDLLGKSSLNVINLECPVIDDSLSEEKRGSVMKELLKTPRINANESDFSNSPSLGNVLWGTANNHLNDFGEAGFRKTLESVTNRGDDFFDPFETDIVRVIELSGKKVLIYNANLVNAEKFGFSLNLNNRGALQVGPEGLNKNLLEIIETRIRDVDVLIGFVHFGRCGNSVLRKVDKKRISGFHKRVRKFYKGPHIFIGHHSHEAGDVAHLKKDNLLIIHSLGNFIFPEGLGKFTEKFYTNFLLTVNFDKSAVSVKLFPIVISDEYIRIADSIEKNDYPVDQFKFTLPLSG